MTLQIDPWRIEEACRRAWPAVSETMVAGWLARSSGGQFRRINSATPGPEALPLESALPELTGHFSALERPAILRIPDFAGIDEAAIEASYGPPEAETDTLAMALRPCAVPATPVELRPRPDSEWLATRAILAGETPQAAALTSRLVGSIADRTAFAAIRREGRIVSLAFAVLHRGLVIFESVRTEENWRGRGFARDCMLALLGWSRDQGAELAALQVVRGNAPAQHLYADLGFSTLVYRYHYRFPRSAE